MENDVLQDSSLLRAPPPPELQDEDPASIINDILNQTVRILAVEESLAEVPTFPTNVLVQRESVVLSEQENLGTASSSSFSSTGQILSEDTSGSDGKSTKRKNPFGEGAKKSVLFDTVTVYHFNRSQGFLSIPSQGGATLGMRRKHFLRRKLSVDLYEEVRRRSRREILLKIRLENCRRKRRRYNPEQMPCSSISSSTSSTSNTTSSSSDSDDESFSDYSDISDSEQGNKNNVFLQPIGIKLRRSLLKACGVGRIDPKEKKECNFIRESRERSGCRCVNQCIPELCECIQLGVNCHVDRVSFPCGCVSGGCQNPLGRTEFDIKRVKGHLYEKLYKVGIG